MAEHKPLTTEDLAAICETMRQREEVIGSIQLAFGALDVKGLRKSETNLHTVNNLLADTVPALVAEVRRLRALLAAEEGEF